MATHSYLNEGKINLIEIQYRINSTENIPNIGDWYVYRGEVYTIGSKLFDTDRGLILLRGNL
jgi:hypothetical protein